MGDLQPWLPHQNGFLAEYNPPPPPPPLPLPLPQPSNPDPSEIREEIWRAAERATEGVIEEIQATVVSERRRQEVVEFVQRLIRYNLNCEVFPFGSVPLKTYLPDGDIDLTALGLPNTEDILANHVRQVLETEEQNNDSEFEVKDVQHIHAEVKLVKCLVQNIVVDISFNQSGGLSTLCFLEKVDREVGKDHLFKRSIILIKAWCYYESRILGAHHGLISTYALETLVLYIFHLFHSSLDAPLAVLYRFLDYYSKFDWDRYCVSLYGPILVSSLPELAAEAPENEGGDLLFTKEFLNNCVDHFNVFPKGSESNKSFPQKYLNIVDPLKENNNLGRSVSRGNFYRIRSAFTYGARKLGRILLLPSVRIAAEINMFFANTLDRHGSEERPDVQDAHPSCLEITSDYPNGSGSPSSELQSTGANRELCEEINAIKLSGMEKNGSRVEPDAVVEGRSVVGYASKVSSSGNIGEKSKAQISTSERNSLPNGKAFHIPHLFFHSENGYQNGRPSQPNPSHLIAGKSVSSTRPVPSNEEGSTFSQPDSCESESSTSGTSWFSTHGSFASSWNTEQLENLNIGDCSLAGTERNRASVSFKSKKLADLSGDLDVHFRNLLYVQWAQEYILGNFYPVYAPPPSYQHRNNSSWDASRRRGAFARMNTNGVASGSPFSPSGAYPTTSPFIPATYGVEDLPKTRGTGTYFPNTNFQSYKERLSPGRGKYSVHANHFSRYRSNGRAETPLDANLEERGGHEPPPQLQLPIFNGNGRGKTALSDMSNSPRHSSKEASPSKPLVFPPEGELEFGSFGHVRLGASSPEPVRRLDSVSPRTQGLGLTIPASTVQRPSISSNRDRSNQGYRLKDVGDFPPLSG